MNLIKRVHEINKRTLHDVIWCHIETTSRKTNRKTNSVKFYNFPGDKKSFISLVCVGITAAVDKINKKADYSPLVKKEIKEKFVATFWSNVCIIKSLRIKN